MNCLPADLNELVSNSEYSQKQEDQQCEYEVLLKPDRIPEMLNSLQP